MPPDSAPPSVDTLARALAQFPELAPDPLALAIRLAPMLAARAAPDARPTRSGPGSAESRILTVVTEHPAGRAPGLTPDALATLTGLSALSLGRTVSAMIQAGQLVRDAWLVRLPEPGDLLPHARAAESAAGEDPAPDDDRLGRERRAIGDRRAVGERRLYERRNGGIRGA